MSGLCPHERHLPLTAFISGREAKLAEPLLIRRDCFAVSACKEITESARS